uniref:Uncharacterized protein n=1 Tax=Oryza glaberrima TaxID=4538 RepID=I1R0L2_ORYGL
MGRTWPVGTASGIGAIAGGAATDWIGASSSMDGFGCIRSDGRGHLVSPEVDGGGSVRERATVVIVDAVHRRVVETLLHPRPVAQIRYSRGNRHQIHEGEVRYHQTCEGSWSLPMRRRRPME